MIIKLYYYENCAACHVHSQGLCYMRIHVHQRVPATRFNNIFLKLFDRYATYCYIQVSLRSKRFRAV